MMAEDQNIDWEDFKLRHEAAVAYAQATLKTLLLVNGGAIIALLTFLGNNDVEVEPRGIFFAFVWFSIGLALTMLAHGLAYIVQVGHLQAAAARMANAEDLTADADRSAGWFTSAAALCCMGGLFLFIVGAFVALVAIT